MNKIAQGLIGATAAILLLAGCSAISAEAQGVPTPTPSATLSSTPEPIAAKAESPSPSPSHNPDWGNYTQDEFYLLSVAPPWQGPRPTDAKLIALAHVACAQLAAGTKFENARPVPGKSQDDLTNSLGVTTYAVQVYCPEFTP